jgi:hypothetical protein
MQRFVTEVFRTDDDFAAKYKKYYWMQYNKKEKIILSGNRNVYLPGFFSTYYFWALFQFGNEPADK